MQCYQRIVSSSVFSEHITTTTAVIGVCSALGLGLVIFMVFYCYFLVRRTKEANGLEQRLDDGANSDSLQLQVLSTKGVGENIQLMRDKSLRLTPTIETRDYN